MSAGGFLGHPLLRECGVAHGFGLRQSPAVAGVWRPRQVHGARVADAAAQAPGCEADAVVSARAGLPVGVLTADCVPLLLASADGAVVAAVHAGWRGLAAGVVAAGCAAFAARHGRVHAAVLGPHIGACCYEVDAPVLDALRARFPAALDAALEPSRPGHARLGLAALVAHELRGAGLDAARIGCVEGCTRCDALRFHSHRRDGAAAGRLLHWIAAAPGVDTPEGHP